MFGNTALFIQETGAGNLVASVSEDVAVALFRFLEHLPLETISISIATALVVTFFVTSSDSASLVIDIITTSGVPEPPAWQRIFWALLQGVVAAVLLLAGGLAALQTGAIASGFPLAIIILALCYGLYAALREEIQQRSSIRRAAIVTPASSMPWRDRLAILLQQPTRERAQRFLEDVVIPALNAVAGEFAAKGMSARVEAQADEAALHISSSEHADFLYRVRLRSVPVPSFTVAVEGEREGPDRTWRAEVWLESGELGYDIMGFRREQVIADLLAWYERHVHYLAQQAAPGSTDQAPPS